MQAARRSSAARPAPAPSPRATTATPDDGGTQRSVQSAETGGRLLLALADAGMPLGLKDLAERAGLSPSRTHPYLVSYARLGLVEQQSASGRYALGPAALQLGLACLRQLDPLRAAEPVVLALAEHTGHAVALAVWGNQGPTIVRLIDAREPLHVALRVGSVMSLTATATGRAFAATLPQEQLLRARTGALGEPLGPSPWSGSRDELGAIAAEVQRHGVARAVGLPIPGVNAFSAPVRDHEGQVALVITVLDHEDRLDPRWQGNAVQALREAAREVAQRLGAPG
jgi:DNA-binding IclR family transcriptional regulator